MRSRRLVIAAAAALALLVSSALLGLRWAHVALHEPWKGWVGADLVVEIPVDAGAREALDGLARAGVLRHPVLLERWLVLRGLDRELRAGEYRFDRALSPVELADRMRAGDVLLHAVTIPEGLTLEESAARVSAAGFGTVEAALGAFRDPSVIRDLDPTAPDLEGYLFPDTYRFAKGTAPEAVVRTIVSRFREIAGPGFADGAAAVGLSARQAVILASLVEEETARADERARVARVYLNRLRKRMLLQCDPTVLYALRRDGRPTERLLRGHLAHPSPWNTYRVRGLPPGPICSPGRASLEAVLRPAPGDDLYFVAAPGGGHRFSRDLASHERAVREWRRYLRSSR